MILCVLALVAIKKDSPTYNIPYFKTTAKIMVVMFKSTTRSSVRVITASTIILLPCPIRLHALMFISRPCSLTFSQGVVHSNIHGAFRAGKVEGWLGLKS
jgi:hypothetical protein